MFREKKAYIRTVVDCDGGESAHQTVTGTLGYVLDKIVNYDGYWFRAAHLPVQIRLTRVSTVCMLYCLSDGTDVIIITC